MTAEAVRHLRNADPVLARLIRRVGPCQLRPRSRVTPFEALTRAIAHQQLNGTAADTILRRFRALFPRRRFPRPADLDAITDDALRAAGFSRAKVAALRDLAAKTRDGLVPRGRHLRQLSDDDVVRRLTDVRGVGRWTAEMLLIQTGRPDVLPADDFGVRNGFRLAFGLPELPRPRDVLVHGECWRPHRTTASWYLWRAVEVLGRRPAPPS